MKAEGMAQYTLQLQRDVHEKYDHALPSFHHGKSRHFTMFNEITTRPGRKLPVFDITTAMCDGVFSSLEPPAANPRMGRGGTVPVAGNVGTDCSEPEYGII
jgi:hypothetical protein